MSLEIPQIQTIGKMSTLYRNYEDISKCIIRDKYSDSVIPVLELSNLDGIIKNSDSYLTLADSVYRMTDDVLSFRSKTSRFLAYDVENVISILKDKSKSNFLQDSVDSTHQWLKDVLGRYVTEINDALEPVEEGDPISRVKINITRINDSISDCYKGENLTRLSLASDNLYDGLEDLRKIIFPEEPEYTYDEFPDITRDYVNSLIALRKFSEGKQIVSFSINDNETLLVDDFKDKSPIPEEPKEKGFWTNIFGE